MMKLWMIGAIVCISASSLAENICIAPVKWERRLTNEEQALQKPDLKIYKSFLVIPEGHEKNRWLFESDRAGGNFEVFVNDKRIGECQAPFIHFELANLKSGTNEVKLLCHREYEGMKTINPKTNPYRERRLVQDNGDKKYRGYTMGFNKNGVKSYERFREVSTPADVRTAWTETSVREKKIAMKIRVDVTKKFTGTAVVSICDKKNKEVLKLKKKFEFDKGLQLISMESEWKNPLLWDVGKPNLYTAKISIVSEGGRVIDEFKPFQFGFREVWVEGKSVILNGHPLHLRPEMFLPLNEKTLGLFKYIGRNCVYFQPHHNNIFGMWGEVPNPNLEMLDLMDREGLVGLFPSIGVTDKCELTDTSLLDSFKDNTEKWMDIMRHHPCIIGWGVSMNAYNPKIEGISPDFIGRRQEVKEKITNGWAAKKLNILRATNICREVDPTRLSYGHADGNIGSFGSGNCYPNMTPLQEVEEYPIAWYRDGDMPWMAVEYDVYNGSFYKDGVLLLTEYAATYFGEKAYDKESVEYLSKVNQLGADGGYHGKTMGDVCNLTDLYWDFMRQYTQGTHKYWRSYGILGWVHFFGGDFGQPKGRHCRWETMEATSETEAPPWASPQVEIQRKYMQSFMSYIGGDEVFSDKTHSFYDGESVKKNVVCVWDGADQVNAVVMWAVKDSKGKVVAKNKEVRAIKPGTVEQVPITFVASAKSNREAYKIIAAAYIDGSEESKKKTRMDDKFEFEVFPKKNALAPIVARPSNGGKVYLYDPAEKSAWVKSLLPNAIDYKDGLRLNKGDVLIIGRQGLKVNQTLPYNMDDVKNGARVLILEQLSTLWVNFGFRLTDMCTRIAYETPYSKELMGNLTEKDLRYWRGTPNLMPEFRNIRSVQQPPKGVNRHGIASTVFEIPDAVGFEPMFQCEFDLRFSPLLRLRSGFGAVYYSSFDFTDRVGVDPAATQLARNLLTLAMKETTPAKETIFVNTGVVDPKTDGILKKGGIVLNVALSDEELTKRGIKFEKKKLYKATLDGFLKKTCATRNMFRWRDALDVNCITEAGAECEGIWYRRGNECFLQVASGQEVGKYERGDFKASVCLSVLMLDMLKTRIITALNGAPLAENCSRLNHVYSQIPYTSIKDWYAYGPFCYKKVKPVGVFEDIMPGEEQAIRGDVNPNPTYRITDGEERPYDIRAFDEETRKATYDFRKMISACDDGYVNLTDAFQLKGRGAYCYLIHTWSEPKECEAMFGFSFPASAEIYLNGEKVFSRKTAYNNSLRELPLDFFKLKLKLKNGENAISVKLNTLPENMANRPMRFGCTRMLEGFDIQKVIEMQEEGSLYNKKGNINYVYRYHYW